MSIARIEAKVNMQEMLAKGIFSMWLSVGEMAREAVPGQFLSIYSRDSARLLPRPISICEVNRELYWIRIVYRIAGAGTKEFSGLRPGDRVTVMGPLGNGYTMRQGKKSLLIAGGIGIPPLLELAKELDGEKDIVLGYRDAGTFLAEEFAPFGRVYLASEDGSTGTKGTVMDAIREKGLGADVIYSCGPRPMLKAVKAFAIEQDIECQISMEERMACGIGACLSCVCPTVQTDAHTNVKNKRICREGPVFEAREVEL